MRRAAIVVIVLAIAAAATAFFVGRGGGSDDKPVAHVGDQPIRKQQLAAVVHHFRLESEAEGNPFPADDSAAGRRIRNRLLGVLVYRAELRQAARRLGIRVTNVQVLKRLQSSSGGEESTPDSFAYGSAESQLLFERIYAKITRGIGQSARRNDAMTRFVDRLKRETKVRYEPGYAPDS